MQAPRRSLAMAFAIAIALPASAAQCPRNPVLDQEFADPDILPTASGYLAYATNSAGKKVQVAASPDLVNWALLKDALPKLPRWAIVGWTWAPDVIRIGDGAVIYFTARNRQTGDECIGAATSKAPEGPFVPSSDQPLVCQGAEGGSIDASAFRSDDGTLYLIWKNDGNSRGMNTFLYLQRLSADGVTLSGTPQRLLKQDLPWEGQLIEAPVLWQHGGRTFLFYSANAYGDRRYAVGYAVADRIDGPYRKHPTPLLASADIAGVDYIGPGGQTIVIDKAGQDWMAFHSWSADHSRRVMNIAPLDWPDGEPVVRLDCRN